MKRKFPRIPRSISIHALREEGDGQRKSCAGNAQNFNPRPPRGGRHPRTWDYLSRFSISIHALREEGDLTYAKSILIIGNFNPRPPRGGRRAETGQRHRHCQISIHALREEGDPPGLLVGAHPVRFQSTPSARRATVCREVFRLHPHISIHALREEGDSFVPSLQRNSFPVFQSTPSARRATA